MARYKNEEIYVRGKTKFAFVNRLNQFGKWVVGIYPDNESLGKIKKLVEEGIKNELKKDDDNQYWIAFSRPPDKTDRQGRKFSLNPPVVVDKDGRAFSGGIGNDSDVALKLEVYGGKTPIGTPYKAARLGGVKIYNLVPYEPETMAEDPFEAKAAKGLNAQPEPTDTW